MKIIYGHILGFISEYYPILNQLIATTNLSNSDKKHYKIRNKPNINMLLISDVPLTATLKPANSHFPKHQFP